MALERVLDFGTIQALSSIVQHLAEMEPWDADEWEKWCIFCHVGRKFPYDGVSMTHGADCTYLAACSLVGKAAK